MKNLLLFAVLVSLPLLLGSVCNAELRTWTAVNGKEVKAEFVSNEKGIVKLKLKSGKVFEVPAKKLSKKDNEFISSLAKPDGVNSEELEYREGFYYLLDSDTPYTGNSFTLWKNGQKRDEVNYKDGKPDGLTTGWYENGQKKIEANYKDGRLDGVIANWYENGQKKSEQNYKKGKLNGNMTAWHENGKKMLDGNYKEGIQNGLMITWHNNGSKMSEGNFKNGIKEGLFTRWYENQQKKDIVNFKYGKPQGLQLNWYRNGQKKSEVNYEKGKKEGPFTEWHESGQKKGEASFKADEIISVKYWNKDGESVDTFEEAEAE